MSKPEFEFKDGKIKVSIELKEGIDKDKDGKMSASISGTIVAEIDGPEALDELAKSSEFVNSFKAKLGIK